MLRLENVNIVDSSNIEAYFSYNLSKEIAIQNIEIISKSLNVPNATTISVRVSGNKLFISCQPLTPYAAYDLTFKSTSIQFTSIDGAYTLPEDGVSNLKTILGPPETENVIRDLIRSSLKDNVYNSDDPNTIIGKLIESYAGNLSKCLYDVYQIKNENYISHLVEDEEKTRGLGPFDRLNEGGAYEIVRVAKTKTGNRVAGSYEVSYFNPYPLSLQSESVASEILTPDSADAVGVFNTNSLVLNLKNTPALKLKSVRFQLSSDPFILDYPIDILGYQIKDNRYDQDRGFRYVILEDNQIKLNDSIVKDGSLSVQNIVRLEVSYEYKDLGKDIYEDSLDVWKAFVSSRETLPPIINIFDLKHAPIVDNFGNIATIGGVLFVDPNSVDVNAVHPAFQKEIPFRLESLPSQPGQYSVDYPNGRVYVFGKDSLNRGTGEYPPVATYRYKFSYVKEIDYVYDSTFKEIVALPKGSLIESDSKISFEYEKNLVNGVDFVANVHKESLFERVGGRLLDSGTLKVLNKPVTNVFRLTNETTGEVYLPTRWENDKVYFNYNFSPKLGEITGEIASFTNVSNEVIYVSEEKNNASSIRFFIIPLNNNQIISNTEDCIGSNINSSIYFTNKSIFKNEIYFKRLSSNPEDYLTEIGDYCIDYSAGVVYCAVSESQDKNIGFVSYKFNRISTIKKNIISVEDVYYQVSSLGQKNKKFNYSGFEDGGIFPTNLDYSDELFYKNDQSYPYQLVDGKVSFYDGTNFVGKVSEPVKQVRGLFEYEDLVHNKYPINFSENTSFQDDVIYFSQLDKVIYGFVQEEDGYLFVNLPIQSSYISPNINFNISILKDGYELWDSSGEILPGEQIKLILSGLNSPSVGDYVTINYSVTIDNLARVMVDYNKGDLYTDYTVVEDELLISYEYGDNVLDFRTSKTISSGSTYYVTYKVGALRDALARNFGSLLAIPELNNLNVDLDRERYRDCVYAGLSSFIQGPTVEGMKNLIKQISHTTPEVIESVFNNWSLGDSLLYPGQTSSSGEFSLVPSKFGNGVLINSSNQTITLPQSSNLSVSQGTFETWITPEWDGIDNTSDITLSILKGNSQVDSKFIFIGSEERHPENYNGEFSLNKSSVIYGAPNKNKNGVFIYYDKDSSNLFDRWYVDIVDSDFDGYYNFEITSKGKFYDFKNVSDGYFTTTTFSNKIKAKLQNFAELEQRFTFICDKEHYLLDSGEDSSKNRLSIYKDSNGYLNFRVFDKYKNSYYVNADVSSWKKGEKHFVAASWKLNSENEKDEMHLFIDGFEVPNDIKWGQRLLPYPHENFKTINPEFVIAASDKDIIGSNDLSTTADGYEVSTSVSLGAYDIDPGDRIYIDDPLFDQNGYEIASVAGNSLFLTESMPVTLSNLRYSVNKSNFTLKLDAAIYPNVTVSTISSVFENIDLQSVADSDIVTSFSSNFENIKPGYIIRILDGDFDFIYNVLSVPGDYQLILDQKMPVTKNNLTFYIYSNVENELPGKRANEPYYQLSMDGYGESVLTVRSGVFAKDLLILNTLGVNFRSVKTKYYCWSYQSSSTIPVRLPPPVSIPSVKITRIIVDNFFINQNPKTFAGDSVFKPSNLEFGRKLTACVFGTKAVFPVKVTILGYDIDSPEVDGYHDNNVLEEIIFTDYGKKDTTHNFIHIESVLVEGDGSFSFELREKNPITYFEGGDLTPVIKYSYQIASGTRTLKKGSLPDTVIDNTKFFSSTIKGNILSITDPGTGVPEVAGIYQIIDVVGPNELKLSLNYPMANFEEASYEILNVLDTGTGFQNGKLILEQEQLVGSNYYLNRGFYEIEYDTYLSVKIDPFDNGKIYFGSDIIGNNQADAVIDQVKIYDICLSDTRKGETISENERSVTKDYNSLVPLRSGTNTLVLINFDSYPFLNKANFYVKNFGKNFVQSDRAINDYFNKSILFKNNSLSIDNFGILDTKKEGTIEFWVNPLYDSQNDPVERYYFDAYGAKSVDLVSDNNTQIILNELAESVLSVTIKNGDPSINYFAGGNLSYQTSNAIQKEANGVRGDSMVALNSSDPEAAQVISVTIKGDPSKKDYFGNGSIKFNDRRTILLEKPLVSKIGAPTNITVIVTYRPINSSLKTNSQVINLNKKLPKDKCNVVVKFLPKGFEGDRISIYKDTNGLLRFKITTPGSQVAENEVITPIYWSKDTWHRIKASYKINSKNNRDEMRLFVDGHEKSSTLLGDGLSVTDNINLSSSITGLATGNRSINFYDTINQISIGSDYSGANRAYCLLDNLRISSVSRPIYSPYGEAIDPAYSSNVNTIYPVTKDLYTTYLLDFDHTIKSNEDFTLILSKDSNNFNFGINIFDSFGIINDSAIVKQILEILVKKLKPANSKVYLNYLE